MADLLLRDYQSREKEGFEDYSHINLYEDYLTSPTLPASGGMEGLIGDLNSSPSVSGSLIPAILANSCSPGSALVILDSPLKNFALNFAPRFC